MDSSRILTRISGLVFLLVGCLAVYLTTGAIHGYFQTGEIVFGTAHRMTGESALLAHAFGLCFGCWLIGTGGYALVTGTHLEA